MKEILILFCILLPVGLLAQDTVYLSQPGSKPYLIVYKPVVKKTAIQTGVIICSGGAYGRTADEREGIPAAKVLSENGITAFLLDYRVPHHKDTLPLSDAQKAIRYLREHAKEYHISNHKIGIMGFSAGGHLVSTIGTHWKNNYDNSIGTVSARPDFLVLLYPVISLADSLAEYRTKRNFLGDDNSPQRVQEFSNELQVADDTPPTFIVHSINDGEVPVFNSLYFEAALRQHHVPVDMFLYAKGGHGFGINNEESSVQWTGPCIQWIRNFDKSR